MSGSYETGDSQWHVLVSNDSQTTAYLVQAPDAVAAAAIAAARHCAAEDIDGGAIDSIDASRWTS